LLAVQNTKDGKEQVDDVQVQGNGGSNLLLHVVVLQDELSVHKNIATEDKRCYNTIAKLNLAVVWEKGRHEACNDVRDKIVSAKISINSPKIINTQTPPKR